MLRRNECIDLRFESFRASDHRSSGLPIIEKDFRHVSKLPAMLQGAEPEIPIFVSLNGHGAIVAAILLPNRTPVEGGGVDVIPAQQFNSVKLADMPAAYTNPEAFRIPIDDPHFGV